MVRTSAAVRSGDWLTRRRLRSYALIMICLALLAIVGWLALAHGSVDRNGKPIGTDFSSFYAAGSLALEGRAADVYDIARHYAREQQLFGSDTPYYAWFYPPSFLLIAAPLALLPYPLALTLWQALSFAFYLAVIGALLRPRSVTPPIDATWMLVTAAFPAVLINLGHGQNGFLTAGLLGAALLALPTRPMLAGIAFALLSYKPQFGLVIPFALVAAGQWRAVGAATVTVLALLIATGAMFGFELWTGFAAASETSRHLLLEQGEVGFEKLQSAFAAVRLWGGSAALAYLLQGAVSTIVVGGLIWIWRTACAFDLKAALLAIAVLLASPLVLDYDLVVVAVPVALLTRYGLTNGFRDYEITLLACAWIVPLLTRGLAGATGLPLGVALLTTLFVVTLRRAACDRASLIAAPQRLAST